jgi:mono/diheme cytochrome c family protein
MMKSTLMAAGLLLTSAALAQEPAVHGRALLEDNCASCHAIGKTGDSPRPTAPAFRRLSNSFDLDQFQQHLISGLLTGHPDMPAFKFNEDDARAVVAYLRSIQE